MRCCLFILLHFISYTCLSQTSFSIATYSIKNGLSNNTVNAVIKDDRGFLWIGTSEGLNRFDGSRFLSFFNDPADNASLSGNNIFDILQYRPGYLLIATNNGLSVLNTFTNKFENNKITIASLKKGSGNYVRSLFKNKKANKIYVNYSGEIDVLNDSLQFLYRLTNMPWARALKGIAINTTYWVQDSQNRIWLPSDNYGIMILDEANQQVYNKQNNPMQYPFFKHDAIRSFFYDEKNQVIWFSEWGMGLEKYDLKNRQAQTQYFDLPYGNEARTINAIIENNGRLICGGAQNIYTVDPQTMKFEYLNKRINFNTPYGFINTHTLLHDSDNIWIGTETKGFIQLPATASFVKQLPLPFPIQDYTNFSTGILRSKNGLLYLAYGFDGLLEVNEQTEEVNRYNIPFINAKPQTVFRICEDGQNRLWIGTSLGLYEFDKRTKQFKRSGFLPAFTNKLNVKCLFRDKKGNVWMSFYAPNSLGYFDIVNNRFYYFKNYIVNGKAVFNKQYSISRIIEEENGNIWMTSYQHGGLLCYDAATNQWKIFPRTGKAPDLAQKELITICSIGHSLWLSNNLGLGLVRYDYTNDSVQYLSRKDGLLSENILTITKDQKNRLFLVSKSGINYLNPQTNEMRSIAFNDESIDWGFAYTQFYDSTKNELVYGLNDHIIILENKLWQTRPEALTTYINTVKVNNKEYPLNNNNPVLSLSYFQKNISIDFTSINFNKNASVSYAYKMEGLDKDWNLNQQITTANYSNLPPGHYIFMVKAMEQSGKWGPVNTSLHIKIVPAFWQTAGFWILLVILVALAISLLVRRRIRAIRTSAGLKHRLAEAEMMALRSQMNPHFIFNCLNAIDNLIQTDQADKATTYLARFAKLIRSVLESSKNNLVPFYKDFESLRLFLQLEQFRCNNKFVYQLEADEELLQGDYKVPPLIVQPFVENAIHHGLLNKQTGDRKLIVKASLHPSFIRYTITDNGVGRAQAIEIKKRNKPEQASYGIQITTERIFLHNQNINLNGKTPQERTKDILIRDLMEGELPQGTEVEMIVKIDY